MSTPTLLSNDLGRLCRTARVLSGLRQHATAQAAGLSPNYLSLVEGNHRLPSLRVLRTLNRVYGGALSRLLRQDLRTFIAQQGDPS